MSALPLAAESGSVASVLSGDKPLLYVIAAVAVVALGFAGLFAREVLSADQGPQRMREISQAVQEGAAAYLSRQFRTLAVFAVLVFALLFLLPGDTDVKIGRSPVKVHTSRSPAPPTRTVAVSGSISVT